MSVEEHFGIRLKGDECAEIKTVGDLVQLCQKYLLAAHEPRCRHIGAFYQLRELVRQILHDPSARIRPRESIAARLTIRHRKILWQRLSTVLKGEPHSLRRPPLLRRALIMLWAILAAVWIWPAMAWDVRILPLSLLFCVATVYVLHIITLPLRWHPPKDYQTFGQVTLQAVAAQAATKSTDRTDFVSTFLQVRGIILNNLNVKPDAVTPATRFVEDLGF
ncbi:MAG: hypothetical protein SFX18_10085 [Pirellulales bacterium]|nr:hypothetical protein [Pirellulales bacterium]